MRCRILGSYPRNGAPPTENIDNTVYIGKILHRLGAGIAEHACITDRFFYYHIMFSRNNLCMP